MNRQKFLSLTALGVPAFATSSLSVQSQIDPEIIKEFVIAGHNDLKKVETMLVSTPQLIHSTHDWGNGDFEQAIEGAGHLGDTEIVHFLIQKGARINIFILTLLGKIQVIKPIIEEFPALLTSVGPHGFSLLHYAKMGGENAKITAEYLMEKGLNKTKFQ